MPLMPPTFRNHAARERREVNQQADERRGSARARGYDGKWERARTAHLARNPLCVYCASGAWGEPPRDEAATLVDHFYPHRTFAGVFWRKEWWVSSCDACHSGPKQTVERKGRAALDRLAAQLDLPTFDADRPGGGSKL